MNQRIVNCTLVPGCVLLLAGWFAPLTVAEPCGEWNIVPNPIFDGAEYRPTLIAAFAPDSAVAVDGIVGQGGLVTTTWDGTTWTPGPVEEFTLPSTGDIRAVAGTGPNDVWVAGLYGINIWNSWPYLAHYDGDQWDIMLGSLLDIPNPNGGDPYRSGSGSAIAIIAPDDIWVTGNGESPNGGQGPIAMHWDGSNFEEYVPQIQPVMGSLNNTRAIAAAASDAVWIVGSGRNLGGNDSHVHLYTYRFDGSSWIPETNWTRLPGSDPFSEKLYDVVAFAHDDVWAFGDKWELIDGNTETLPLYLHWDGSGWTEVAGPDIGPISSAAAGGPNDIWVSSSFGMPGGPFGHWDGTAWTEVPSAPLPGATHISLTNLAASPSGDVWAVGSWGIYDGVGGWEVFEDMLEHYVPGNCSVGDFNGDGVVDATDFASMASCFVGPMGGMRHGCEATDLNADGATDLNDFMTFQRLHAETP